MFTFGIGDGVSTSLIKQVANATNGKAIFIKDKDNMQAKVWFLVHLALKVMWSFFIPWNPSSVHRLSTVFILIFSSETIGPIWTKHWWNGPWIVPFQSCISGKDKLPILKIEKRRFLKDIFSSKTAEQINPKLSGRVLRWSQPNLVC